MPPRKQDRPSGEQTRNARTNPRPPWIRLAAGSALLLMGMIAVLMISRSRDERPQTSAAPPAATGPIIPDESSVFAQYAGSASCRECHAEAYEEWQGSHHGLAERLPDASLDEPAFHPQRRFQHGTQYSEVMTTNGEFRVVALGRENRYEPFTVERVIGHDPLRQFLVKFPGGRLQTLEASYDPHSNEWFNVYGEEDRKPGEWGHWTGRGMNWNSMCASCHNTRVRKNYDARTDSFRTTMAERTVGCESCHGPMKSHNEWQAQFGKSGRPDPTLARLNRQQTMENCAYCHARRSELTGDFKPGDSFLDHLRLSIVDDTDIYYPDGQVREENFEYAAFLGSRMHQRGVSCQDCHHPHTMKTILPGNWLCLRCHDGSRDDAPAINPVTHSHHKVFGYDTNGVLLTMVLTAYRPKQVSETGGECVNCHMPQTVYMQRHRRHDHGFTIPDPVLTKELGIPNACNRCHQDKDVEWSIAAVEKWYGPKMERPSRQRARTIAAARNGERAARDGLLRLLHEEENPYWQAAAAKLLQPWANEPSIQPALINSAGSTSALVRVESIAALEPLASEIHSPVTQALRGAMDDPVRSVRLASAWALRSSVDAESTVGRELLHWLDLHTDQPVGQMQKGNFALARQDRAAALAHFFKAVEWDPNSAPLRHDLAVVLSEAQRISEAIAQLEAACRIEPRHAEYRYKLALAWNEAGQPAKTLAELETAVRLDPHHGRAWYNLGLALHAAGRTEEALTALHRAESVAPADPRSPYARATILAQLGRTNDARQAARRALEIQPGFQAAVDILNALR